jgi:hypothetical protein
VKQFWIADFGFWIEERKRINKKHWLQVLGSCSDNRKSKIQNREWAGLFAIVVALMVCGARAEAQQPKQVPRIGYLTITGSGLPPVFVKGLRDLGYVEGKNIAFVFRTAEGKYERYSNVLAELVHLNVDIIVVSGGIRAITAAKNATKTISYYYGRRWDRSCGVRPS